jgi:hypothetical protein
MSGKAASGLRTSFQFGEGNSWHESHAFRCCAVAWSKFVYTTRVRREAVARRCGGLSAPAVAGAVSEDASQRSAAARKKIRAIARLLILLLDDLFDGVRSISLNVARSRPKLKSFGSPPGPGVLRLTV